MTLSHATGGEPSSGSAAALEPALGAVLRQAVTGDPPVRNGVLRVGAPGFHFAGAEGESGTAASMRAETPFRSASVGKTFCAATVMSLVEEGAVELDAPFGRYLRGGPFSQTRGPDGRPLSALVTIRHLLAHRSGLPNYFRHPEFGRMMVEEPDRLWDPQEVLAWVAENDAPLFAPGEGWHYSDTGYLLLGLVVEAVTGRALDRVYRERIFAPLGMESTYMPFREERPEDLPEPAHVYLGDLDYTAARSLSADWAGGGLVLTAGDLERFLRALVGGTLFRERGTTRRMHEWGETGEAGVQYGLGVRRFLLERLGMSGSGEVWGHSGSSGSFMFYWPERDATVCGTLNQDLARGAWSETLPVVALVPEVLRTIQRYTA